MRLYAALLAAASLGACVPTGGTSGGPSTASASSAAFTIDPRPEPTPLPPLSPTSRPNRQIESMPAAELARWIFPARASEISTVEIFPPRWGVITYAYFWRAPRSAESPGICVVDGWGVGFQVENERSLTPQQSVDPPLRPAWTVPERRFRVAGSTLAGSGTPDCASAGPYWRWSEAPSAEALHLAASLMEQAQLKARGSGPLGFRLSCTQMRFEEGRSEHFDRPCPDARVFLQRLTPNLIKRVRSSQCEGDISRLSEGDCIAVEYHDPAAPGTHSIYMVRIAGRTRPEAIEIVQGMLPPQ